LIQLYHDCLDGMGGLRAWPDGGALLDQPVKLTQAFRTIAFEKARDIYKSPT
jgi:hypothetical protein